MSDQKPHEEDAQKKSESHNWGYPMDPTSAGTEPLMREDVQIVIRRRPKLYLLGVGFTALALIMLVYIMSRDQIPSEVKIDILKNSEDSYSAYGPNSQNQKPADALYNCDGHFTNNPSEYENCEKVDEEDPRTDRKGHQYFTGKW